VAQSLEILCARDEIGLAIDFHENADFPSGVNVMPTSPSLAWRDAFFCRPPAFLPEDVNRASILPSLPPAPNDNRRIRACPLAKLLHHLGGNSDRFG